MQYVSRVAITSYGWCAVVAGPGGLTHVQFGFADPQDAHRWCTERLSQYRAWSGSVARSARQGGCSSTLPECLCAPDLDTVLILLQRYFSGEYVDFRTVPVDWREVAHTEFQYQVLQMCRTIPYGSVWTYRQLAVSVGSPKAARAVGAVMKNNRLPIIIPCHRVIGARGALTGYSAPGGLATKRALLEMEQTCVCRRQHHGPSSRCEQEPLIAWEP